MKKERYFAWFSCNRPIDNFIKAEPSAGHDEAVVQAIEEGHYLSIELAFEELDPSLIQEAEQAVENGTADNISAFLKGKFRELDSRCGGPLPNVKCSCSQ